MLDVCQSTFRVGMLLSSRYVLTSPQWLSLKYVNGYISAHYDPIGLTLSYTVSSVSTLGVGLSVN